MIFFFAAVIYIGLFGCLILVSNMAQIRLREYGILDFDSGDARRQPPVDTTWQQVTHNFPTCFEFSAFVLENKVELHHLFIAIEQEIALIYVFDCRYIFA